MPSESAQRCIAALREAADRLERDEPVLVGLAFAYTTPPASAVQEISPLVTRVYLPGQGPMNTAAFRGTWKGVQEGLLCLARDFLWVTP